MSNGQPYDAKAKDIDVYRSRRRCRRLISRLHRSYVRRHCRRRQELVLEADLKSYFLEGKNNLPQDVSRRLIMVLYSESHMGDDLHVPAASQS